MMLPDMKTLFALKHLTDQIPEKIRPSFQVKLRSDPFFLEPVAVFKDTRGNMVECRCYPNRDGIPVLDDATIAKLCLLAE